MYVEGVGQKSGPCTATFNDLSRLLVSSESACFSQKHAASRYVRIETIFFFSIALPAHSGPWPLIQFRNHFYTDDRTSWTSDQLVARPLPKYRTTQTQNKRIHTPNIYALSGIQIHDPSVRANEDSSCLRQRGYCDRQWNHIAWWNYVRSWLSFNFKRTANNTFIQLSRHHEIKYTKWKSNTRPHIYKRIVNLKYLNSIERKYYIHISRYCNFIS
jgi:hypothetical protein